MLSNETREDGDRSSHAGIIGGKLMGRRGTKYPQSISEFSPSEELSISTNECPFRNYAIRTPHSHFFRLPHQITRLMLGARHFSNKAIRAPLPKGARPRSRVSTSQAKQSSSFRPRNQGHFCKDRKSPAWSPAYGSTRSIAPSGVGRDAGFLQISHFLFGHFSIGKH